MTDHNMADCDFDMLGWRVKARSDALSFDGIDWAIAIINVALTSLNVAGLLWNAC